MKKQTLLDIPLLIIIIVLLNLIASYIYLRFDFTSGRIYSISKPTKKLLKKLERPVIITAYFTKNLPLEYQNHKRYLEDLLREYKIYSRGNIRYKFVDPSIDKDMMRECTASGIPPVRFTQIKRDKYEVVEGFMGVLFRYGDKTECIPLVKDMENLEYDITSRIRKMTLKEKKKIVFTKGSDEYDVINELPELSQKLRDIYELKSQNPNTEEFDKDASAILIIGPRKKFTEEALFRIDQAIISGIPTGFLIDRFSVDQNTFWAKKLDLALEPLLEHYGVEIKPGFLMDLQNQRIVIRTSQAFFVVENILNYPLFPIVTNLKKDHAITKDLQQVTLTYTNPIELKEKENIKSEILMTSSEKAWFRDNLYSLSPFGDYYPKTKSEFKKYNIMATISGKFKSYFIDKAPKGKEFIPESITNSRILVLPSSGFIRNEPVLFFNIVDWLAADEELISIRSKRIVPRQLKSVPYGVKLLYKYSIMILPSAFVLAFGLIRWKIRSEKGKILQRLFGT